MTEPNEVPFEERYVQDHTNETEDQKKDRLIRWCNLRAMKCLQKAWIFDRRGRRYRFRLKVLTFLGVAVPAAVGTIVLSFAVGVDQRWFKVVLTIAGILSVAQIVLALWALSAKWDDAHAYATESASANRSLYREYIMKAQFPPNNVEEFQRQYDGLGADYQCRRASDDKQILTPKELMAGRQAAIDHLKNEDDVDLTQQGTQEPSQERRS